jgi:G3E family GTPase
VDEDENEEHDDDDEHEHHHHHEDEDHHHDHDDEDDEHEHHHHHHHHHEGGEVEEYGIGTYVYFRRRPFDIHKFDRFVSAHWPKNIIRAKGICYFSHNTDMSFLFEQAGVQKTLREAGLWYATMKEDELIDLLKREPGLLRDWDDTWGDRMQKIVFIGQKLDKDFIRQQLDECLMG